jgi:1,4-alpha-glucan branching enzyme
VGRPRLERSSVILGVLYELHIGTFTREGTFDAALDRLDHLVDLGITHVEFMPVSQFSGNHGWGYDGVDLYAPHSAYGGPEALKRLVDACHARHLALSSTLSITTSVRWEITSAGSDRTLATVTERPGARR